MVSSSGTPTLFPWMSQPPSPYIPQQHGPESWFTNRVGVDGCQYHTSTHCGLLSCCMTSAILFNIGSGKHWFWHQLIQGCITHTVAWRWPDDLFVSWFVMVSPSGTPALFPWMSQPPSPYIPQQHGLDSWFTNQWLWRDVNNTHKLTVTLWCCMALAIVFDIGSGIDLLYSSLGQRTESSLVQVMACHILSAKPLPEPRLIYYLTGYSRTYFSGSLI